MLKKKILTFVIIAIISMYFVGAGQTVRIDTDNDGVIDNVINDVDDLEWEIFFKSLGAEQIGGSGLPTLAVTGSKSFSMSVQNIPWGSPGYHARWSITWWRQTGSNPLHNWWTADHRASDTISRTKENVGPAVDSCTNCIYNFVLSAYGDGYNHSSPEPGMGWVGASCSSDPIVPCYDPNTGILECDHLETTNSVCQVHTDSPHDCAICNNNPNSCTETDYFCNGVWSEIRFYDGAALELTINSGTWGDAGDVSYSHLSRTWLTDSSPGYVDISQSISICMDEDACGGSQSGCNDASEKWECVQQADNCWDNVTTDCSATGQVCLAGSCVTPYVDCGLRVHDGDGVQTIACKEEPSGWVFKISGSNDLIYGIVTVDTAHADASKVYVHNGSGIVALRKYS